jgi:hypothetical protein
MGRNLWCTPLEHDSQRCTFLQVVEVERVARATYLSDLAPGVIQDTIRLMLKRASRTRHVVAHLRDAGVLLWVAHLRPFAKRSGP